MTWIEIADSAIKIGLGALIAGLFTILSAKANHKREKEKEYKAWRRQTLQNIVDQLTYFHHNFSTYYATKMSHRQDEDYPHDEAPAYIRVKEIIKDVSDLKLKSDSMHSLILILGEKGIESAFEIYSDTAQVMFDMCVLDTFIRTEEVKAKSDILDKAHTSIMTEIGKVMHKQF